LERIVPSLTPQEISDRGDAIYKNKFQVLREKQYSGTFLAIDETTEDGYLDDKPEEAIRLAQRRTLMDTSREFFGLRPS